MLYSIGNDQVRSANDLNHDLKVINQWAYEWKMEFNPDPNKQATDYYFPAKKKSKTSIYFLQWYCNTKSK